MAHSHSAVYVMFSVGVVVGVGRQLVELGGYAEIFNLLDLEIFSLHGPKTVSAGTGKGMVSMGTGKGIFPSVMFPWYFGFYDYSSNSTCW